MFGLGRSRTNREHRFAAENLSAYIDGELTAAERSRLERHLAECAGCRREVETLQETVALLRRVPLKPVPRSFALPASARAVQAHHRRWNRAFGAMRAATVTIATMLMLAFAGDAALTTGLVSLPGDRATSEGAALLAPDRFEAPMEGAQPMIAQGAPEAAPQAEPEGDEVVAGVQATPAEAPVPPETARALQPPHKAWPGPQGQPTGAERGGEGGAEVGGARGAGGAGGVGGGGDMGGPVSAVPRPYGIDGGTAEPEAAPMAEAQVEDLAQPVEATEAPTEAPQAEAQPAPRLAPTPEPEPTQAPAMEPTQAPTAEPTVAADADATPSATASPTPEALAMQADAQDDGGEPVAEAERVMPLDRQPESTWWQAWRSLRLLIGLLMGMLLIALAGTIWAGYKRGTL